MTSIGSFAFQNTAINSVDIPASVTSIGSSAFSNTAITSVVIPASVTSIGQYAFGNNLSLLTLTFAPGSALHTIGEYAFYATEITSVVIPASVTSIENAAFMYPTMNGIGALAELTFESGSELDTIGDYAFSGTSITSVDIPASVTSIGEGAFFGIGALTTITFAEGSMLTSLATDAFAGTNGNTDPVTPLTCTCLDSACPEVVTAYTGSGLEDCVRYDTPEETVILTTTSEVNVGVVVGISLAGIFVCSAIAYAFFTPKRESEQKAEVVQTTEEL